VSGLCETKRDRSPPSEKLAKLIPLTAPIPAG
jgi:hypothetical protein